MAVYLITLSAAAVLLTIYDKIASKHFKKHRVPEAVLLCVGFAGGATSMLLTMLIIRHKTKHNSFMIFLPLFSFVHIIGILYLYLK